MGSDYSRLYGPLTLVEPEVHVLGCGDERLTSNKATHFDMIRPGSSIMAQQAAFLSFKEMPQDTEVAYRQDGKPLLSLRQIGHCESHFSMPGFGGDVFSVEMVKSMKGPVMRLLSTSSRKVICTGRRLNWGMGCVKFGVFLPGQMEPWLIVKGDGTTNDMYIFVGIPQLGGQLVAKLRRRPALPNMVKAEGSPAVMYSCDVAPCVDTAVVVAVLVMIDHYMTKC